VNSSDAALLLDAALPEGPEAPGVARRFVARLRPELPADLMPSVVLLVSEVVTNSYRHGAAGDDVIGLRVSLVDEGVRVEVSDAGAGPTVPVIRRGSVDGGWGLRIVDELSSRWGISTEGRRRVVWFELPTADVGSQPVAGS
jgi:anti-sigma regulatory factor (Ser/Thr protein kinase)